MNQTTHRRESRYCWSRAISSGATTGAPIANGAESITSNHANEKPLKNMPIDALQGLAMAGKIPPTGIEPVA